MPLKKWVDAQIVLPKPKFDQEMADEDAEIDAADAGQDSSPTVFAPPVVKVAPRPKWAKERSLSSFTKTPILHAY